MSKSGKKLPIRYAPRVAVIGSDTLVIGGDEDTTIFDLDAFFRAVPMDLLKTRYDVWRHERDRAVDDRIAATMPCDGNHRGICADPECWNQ